MKLKSIFSLNWPFTDKPETPIFRYLLQKANFHSHKVHIKVRDIKS